MAPAIVPTDEIQKSIRQIVRIIKPRTTLISRTIKPKFRDSSMATPRRNSLRKKTKKTKKSAALALVLEGMSCGEDYSMLLCSGKLFAVGDESLGKLGVGPLEAGIRKPTLLFTLLDAHIVGVAAGKNHTLAWDIQGRVYSWGDSTEGRLGHSVTEVGRDIQ